MVLPWLSFMNILDRSSSAPTFAKRCMTIAMMKCMNAPCSGGLLFLECFFSGLAWHTEFTASLKVSEGTTSSQSSVGRDLWPEWGNYGSKKNPYHLAEMASARVAPLSRLEVWAMRDLSPALLAATVFITSTGVFGMRERASVLPDTSFGLFFYPGGQRSRRRDGKLHR